MVKPSRYAPEEIDRFVERGYWKTTISAVWDKNARECPDAIAIEDMRTALTWEAAKRWTDMVALNLIRLDIERDGVIVVQLPNCVELHLLRVACEKAGILCVPITVNMREREMGYILEFTEASAVVIPWKYREFDHLEMIRHICGRSTELKHIFMVGDEAPAETISVERLSREPCGEKHVESDVLQHRRYKPTEVSIINVTTGTTGFPKFAEYPAAANAAWGEGQTSILRMTAADIVATVAPAARGPSLPAYYDAPWAVARIVMVPWNGPEEALRALQKKQTTVVCLVPTQLAKMMEQYRSGTYDLRSVRLWYSAGAVIPPSLVREVEEEMGGTVISDYGAVDFGGIILPDIADPQEVRMFTVGRPRFGTEVQIVDDSGNPVGTGEVGEILCRGPSCCSGYYKNQEATANAWSKDGWFAMGDLGKTDVHGNIIIVGRKKDVIIRGGQNIYPDEIEHLLIMYGKVQDAAVVGMPDSVMGERACAYVVPKPGERLAFEEMVSFLREQNIAAFKIPERLEIIDRLPLVSDQKVDRKALRQDIVGKLDRERREER